MLSEIILPLPSGTVWRPDVLHAYIYRAMDAGDTGRQFIFKGEKLGGEIAIVRSRFFPARYQLLTRPAYYFADRDVFDFHLRAAPHKKDGATHKITRVAAEDPADDDEAYVKWLQDRAPNYGFELVDRPALSRRPRAIRSKGALVVTECDYAGRLKITDRHRFEVALECGLGPRKAYGYGLLTLYDALS